MRRFDGAPMLQPILFKSAIYWLCVRIVRLAEELVHFVAARRRYRRFRRPLRWSISDGEIFANSDMVEVLFLSTLQYTNLTSSSETVNCIGCSFAGARPRPSSPAVSVFVCSHVSTDSLKLTQSRRSVTGHHLYTPSRGHSAPTGFAAAASARA